MVLIPLLLGLVPPVAPELSLKCTAGEVTIHASDGARSGPAEGTRVASGAEASPFPCPFTFAAGPGARFEASGGDLRLSLSGPCEGVVTLESSGFGVLLTNAGGWRVASEGTPVVLALGGRYSVRARKTVFEGSFVPASGVVLKNVAGEPLRIYRDGRMVDVLPESLRARIAEAALAPDAFPLPKGESAPREYRWGERAYALPPGVAARVDRGRLVIEALATLTGSAVLILDGRFVLIRAGGAVEVGPNGEILEARGPARVLRALGASRAPGSGFPGSLGVDPTQTGVVLSPS
ncbi:MAG TPA: hypothetical protein VFI25_05085 [Planctomycetota bacterium]|jgi:hypothetical protein|nr:hypothetical protein [Planctomycetota bacterium]